jgi:hypothetical protein
MSYVLSAMMNFRPTPTNAVLVSNLGLPSKCTGFLSCSHPGMNDCFLLCLWHLSVDAFAGLSRNAYQMLEWLKAAAVKRWHFTELLSVLLSFVQFFWFVCLCALMFLFSFV